MYQASFGKDIRKLAGLKSIIGLRDVFSKAIGEIENQESMPRFTWVKVRDES